MKTGKIVFCLYNLKVDPYLSLFSPRKFIWTPQFCNKKLKGKGIGEIDLSTNWPITNYQPPTHPSTHPTTHPPTQPTNQHLTETLCEGLNLSGEDDSDDETVDSHGLTEDDRDQILCLDPDL